MRQLELTLSGRHIRHTPDLVLMALSVVIFVGCIVALFNEGRRSGEWGKVCAYLLAGLLAVVVALAAAWQLSGQ